MKVVTLSISLYAISCLLLIDLQATSAWSWPWSSSRTASGQSSNRYTLKSNAASTVPPVEEEDIIDASDTIPVAFEYQPSKEDTSSSIRNGAEMAGSINTAITNSRRQGWSQLAERGESPWERNQNSLQLPCLFMAALLFVGCRFFGRSRQLLLASGLSPAGIFLQRDHGK